MPSMAAAVSAASGMDTQPAHAGISMSLYHRAASLQYMQPLRQLSVLAGRLERSSHTAAHHLQARCSCVLSCSFIAAHQLHHPLDVIAGCCL